MTVRLPVVDHRAHHVRRALIDLGVAKAYSDLQVTRVLRHIEARGCTDPTGIAIDAIAATPQPGWLRELLTGA